MMKVKNHICDGLKQFQRAGKKADDIPFIREDGYILGSVYENEVPIIYCPFCGIKL